MITVLTVQVTEDDIKIGAIGRCTACPIALAGKRAVNSRGIKCDVVAMDHIGLRIVGKMHPENGIPEFISDSAINISAMNWMVNFDDDTPVKPAEFTFHFE